MAIHYDLKQIKNYQKICYKEITEEQFKDNKVTNALFSLPKHKENGKFYEMSAITWNFTFLLSLTIGVGEITKKNYHQVHSRIQFQEQLNKSFIIVQGQYYYTTLEDVRNHIGLKVNAHLRTPAQFVKNIVGIWKKSNNYEF